MRQELSTAQDDLTAAQTQVALEYIASVKLSPIFLQNLIFKKDLDRTMNEERKAKEITNQLREEIERNKYILSKIGKKSFDDMRRSYEEMKESIAHMEEERAATEQQVRAYKRREDDLKEQLRVVMENKDIMQQSLDYLGGVEVERNHLEVTVS